MSGMLSASAPIRALKIGLVALATTVLLAACADRPPSGRSAAPPPGGGSSRAPLLSAPPADTGFSKPGVSRTQKQEDIRFCFDRSRAIFEHDQRIERDSARFRTDTTANANAARFNRRLRRFGDERSVSRNFERCMADKGYARR